MKNINIFCINLESRQDRWEKVNLEFKNAGIEVIRFPGVEIEKRPWYGCTLSHYKIIKLAETEKMEAVLVLEDDIKINNPKTFLHQIYSLLDKLPNDWHILYLGGLAGRETRLEKVNKNIYKIEGIMCTYGIIYHSRSYSEIIEKIEVTSQESYHNTFVGGFRAIDEFLARKYQKENACYIVWPFMVDEGADFSDIEKKFKRKMLSYQTRFFIYRLGFGKILKTLGRMADLVGLSTRRRNHRKNKAIAEK